MIPICDVQSRRLDAGFKLTKVGVTKVKKPVRVKRNGSVNLINETLTCSIDIFVDLPSQQKGSHLSRNLEIIREIVDDSVRNPVKGIEALAVIMCRQLMQKHEYANYGEVMIVADYFREASTPNCRSTLEFYKLIGRAAGERGKGIRKTVGVEVIGMTACPCAMETVTENLRKEGRYQNCTVPTMSHNQRNVCTVLMEVPEEYEIEANDLIDLIEASFSSPTYEILKRDDEAAVVMNAHANPKFVEDVVRDVLKKVLDKYPQLPDDCMLTVRSESEESIHKHNAFAERHTTMGDLRA